MLTYRPLGRTGINVSTISFGSGGYNRLGQTSNPPLSETEMHRLVHTVSDLGINLFDSSPGYMDSETILGRAFKSMSRNKFFVSTRVVFSELDTENKINYSTPKEIIDSIENSLNCLKLNEIDIALIAASEAADFDFMINEQIPILESLRRQGKIRFLGSSETAATDGNHSWIRAVLTTGMMDVIMIAHSMLNQSARLSVFPYCIKNGIGVMNIYSVRNIFKDSERLTKTILLLQERNLLDDSINPNAPLNFLFKDPDIGTLVEAAYRFVVFTEGVSTAVCSAVSLPKINENICSLAKGPLPSYLIDQLKTMFGHLSEPVGN